MKLVLFDIDGTLIRHIKFSVSPGYIRFKDAISSIFGIQAQVDLTKNYSGQTDKSIVWQMAQENNISRDQFEQKWKQIIEIIPSLAVKQKQEKGSLYVTVPDAVRLVRLLVTRDDITVGLLTGNVERMAWWKLEHAGVTDAHDLFQFGLFGDDADDRNILAKSVFEKAKKHFHRSFAPSEIVVIGDAIGDIQCARAIGAYVIIATTGYHDTDVLKKEKPDLLVDSLLDPKVLDYFHLA